MAEINWHDVLESFTVGHLAWNRKRDTFDVRECPPIPVAGKSLDALEKQIGFRLPKSYRDFCCVFGGGELSECFNILIPNAPNDASDIVEANTLYHDGREYDEYSPDPEQYQRAYFFARDICGGIYFWDPRDVTKERRNEYGVFVVFRDWETKRLANTFDEFIMDVCLGDRHQELFDDPPRRLYQPYRNAT